MRSRVPLTISALLLAAALCPAAAQEGDPFLRIVISLDRQVYFRGQADPVHNLIVNMKVTNTSENEKIHAHFPVPELGPEDKVRFEIYKKGVATGEQVTGIVGAAAAAASTKIVRSPAPQPTGRESFHNTVSVKPGDSQSFRLNPGKYYNMRDAGTYEMTAIFQGVRSNTVTFEVAPIKRVDVRSERLLRDIKTYERGEPGYAYMFYISPTGAPWDAIFFLHRVGTGHEITYERHDLCRIKVRTFPGVATIGRRVALLCADKTTPGLYFLYEVDFDKKPIAVTRTRHDVGSGTRLKLVKIGERFGVEVE